MTNIFGTVRDQHLWYGKRIYTKDVIYTSIRVPTKTDPIMAHLPSHSNAVQHPNSRQSPQSKPADVTDKTRSAVVDNVRLHTVEEHGKRVVYAMASLNIFQTVK